MEQNKKRAEEGSQYFPEEMARPLTEKEMTVLAGALDPEKWENGRDDPHAILLPLIESAPQRVLEIAIETIPTIKAELQTIIDKHAKGLEEGSIEDKESIIDLTSNDYYRENIENTLAKVKKAVELF